MCNALLIDNDPCHAERLTARVRSLNVSVQLVSTPDEACLLLRHRNKEFELIILNVSNMLYPWLNALRRLRRESFFASAVGPPLLCVSKVKQPTSFVLSIEGCGARYALER
jgi:DNA-binding response OmpR family regulator